MSDILLFAAGSLRLAFAPLLSAFQRRAGQKVTAEFGPAGLLRQRIENGKRPQLFASANVAHPQRLVDLGIAGAVQIFARNRLCVTVRNVPALTERPLPQVLFDPHWRLATSTPGQILPAIMRCSFSNAVSNTGRGKGKRCAAGRCRWLAAGILPLCRRADWQRNI